MFNDKLSGDKHLIEFKGEVSSRQIDSILLKIEDAIVNVKWMKSVLRVSYDLLTSSYGRGDEVEYLLDKMNGNYQIYCVHNKVPVKTAEFIVKAINKLKDYDEHKLRNLIKKMAARHSPTSIKETFFEDIIWSIYNIYRRKYAKITANYVYPDKQFVALQFMVFFNFNS